MAGSVMLVGTLRLARLIGPMSLLLGVALAVLWPRPTKWEFEQAAGFDAAQALTHVRMIAREPHPPGTQAHQTVREYILQELHRLPVEIVEQHASATTAMAGYTTGASVHNILCRIPGRAPHQQAVLLAAHYDTVPGSPGASDNGAAVGVLLETARLLVRQAPLQRDIVLMFADGEELGLLGAEAFVRDHPWAKEIGLAVNFEARGTRGDVLMFQISPNDGALVAGFAQSVRFPSANSMFTALSRFLPNDTDFTAYAPRIPRVLGFAFAEGLEHYHRRTDSVAALDPRSLAQLGATATGLARHFGNLTQLPPAQEDAVYLDLLGRYLIHYPTPIAAILGTICAIAWLWLTIHCRRERLISGGGVLRGLGIVGWMLGLSVVVPLLLTWLGGRLLTEAHWIERAPAIGLAALVMVAGVGLLRNCRALCRANPLELGLGVLLIAAILSCVTGWMLPGASIIWQWPTAILLLTWSIDTLLPQTALTARRWLFALPVCLNTFIGVPMLLAAFKLAGPGLLVIPVLLGSLQWSFILPALVPEEAVASSKWGWSVVVAGVVLFGFSTRVPWAGPDPHSKPAAAVMTPSSPDTYSATPAPRTLPEFLVRAVNRSEANRTFEVQLVPTAQARCIHLRALQRHSFQLLSVNRLPIVQHVRFTPELDELGLKLMSGGQWPGSSLFSYCAMQGESLLLGLRLTGQGPVEFQLSEEFATAPLSPIGLPLPEWSANLARRVVLE